MENKIDTKGAGYDAVLVAFLIGILLGGFLMFSSITTHCNKKAYFGWGESRYMCVNPNNISKLFSGFLKDTLGG